MGKYGGKVSLLALMSFALYLTCAVDAFVAHGLNRANNGQTQPNNFQQGFQDNNNNNRFNTRSTGNNAIGSNTQGNNMNGPVPYNPQSNTRSYNRKYSRQKRHMAIDVAQQRFRRQATPTDPPVSWNFHPDTRQPAASHGTVGSNNSPMVIADVPPSDTVGTAQPSQSVSWNFRSGNREPVSRGHGAANPNSPVVIASVSQQGLQQLGSDVMTDSPVHVLGGPPYHVSASDQPTWLSSKQQNTVQTAPILPERTAVNPDIQPFNTMQDLPIIETLSPMKDKTRRTIDAFFPQMTQPSPNQDILVPISNEGATQAQADIGAPTVDTPVHTMHHGHQEHVPSPSFPADGKDITNSLHGTGSHTSGFHPQSQINFKMPGDPMAHQEKGGHQQHGAMNHMESTHPRQADKPMSHHQHMSGTNRMQPNIPPTPSVPSTTPDYLPTTVFHGHGNGMRMHGATANINMKSAQHMRRNLPPTKIKHRARGDDRRDKRRRKITRPARRLPQPARSATKGQLGLSISPQLMNLPPPVADLFPPNLLPLVEQQGLPDKVQGQSSVADTMIETDFQAQTINPMLQAEASFDMMKSIPSQDISAAGGDIYQRIQGLTIKDLAKSNFTTDQIIKALAMNIKAPDVTASQSSNGNQAPAMGTNNNVQGRQGLDTTFHSTNSASVSAGDQLLSQQPDGTSLRQQPVDMRSTLDSSNHFGHAQGSTGPQQNQFDSQHHSSSRQNDRNGRPSWETRHEMQAPKQNSQQSPIPNNRQSKNAPLKRQDSLQKLPMKSIKGVSVQRWFFPGMADIFSSIVSTSPEPSIVQSFQPVYQTADTIPPTTRPPMEYPTPPVQQLPAASTRRPRQPVQRRQQTPVVRPEEPVQRRPQPPAVRPKPPVERRPQPPAARSITPVQHHMQSPVVRPTPPVQIKKRPEPPVQRPTPPLPTAPVAHVTPPVEQIPSVPKARPTPPARRGSRPSTARPKRPTQRRRRPPTARPRPQSPRPRPKSPRPRPQSPRPRPQATRSKPQAPRPRPIVQRQPGRPRQPPTRTRASGQRMPSRNGRRPSGKGRAARPQTPRGRASPTGRRPSNGPINVDATLNMTNTKNLATTKNESKLKRRKLNITRETRIINRPIGPPVNAKTDALLSQIVKELKQPSGTPSPVNRAIETKLGQILELLKSNSNSQPTGTTAPPFDIMQLLALQQMGDMQPMPPMMGMMPAMQGQMGAMGAMMPPMIPTTPIESSSKPSNAGQMNPMAMMMNSMLQGNGSQPDASIGGNMGMPQLFPDLAAMGGLMPGQNSTAATGQGGLSAPMMQMLMAQFAQSNNENNNNNQCRCYPKLLGCPNDTIPRNGRGGLVKCKKTEIRCCDDN